MSMNSKQRWMGGVVLLGGGVLLAALLLKGKDEIYQNEQKAPERSAQVEPKRPTGEGEMVQLQPLTVDVETEKRLLEEQRRGREKAVAEQEARAAEFLVTQQQAEADAARRRSACDGKLRLAHGAGAGRRSGQGEEDQRHPARRIRRLRPADQLSDRAARHRAPALYALAGAYRRDDGRPRQRAGIALGPLQHQARGRLRGLSSAAAANAAAQADLLGERRHLPVERGGGVADGHARFAHQPHHGFGRVGLVGEVHAGPGPHRKHQ